LIAKNYISSWFIIDVISVIPFDVLLQSGNLNDLFRFARIGKLYKMLRILRLVKILKLIRSNRGVVRHFSERMKINSG
jgi:hypothetical protein